MIEHYNLTCGPQNLTKHFGVTVSEETGTLRALTNRAQLLPVIHNQNPTTLSMLRWGLIPSWAQPTQQYNNLINAKVEALLTKPAYQKPFMQRRCLVPATGFYFDEKTHIGIRPHHYTLKNAPVFAFAGIWDRWRASPEVEVDSFTIIVCPANELIRPAYSQMPIILRPQDYATWLRAGVEADDLLKLLVPFPATEMEDRDETPEQIAIRFGIG